MDIEFSQPGEARQHRWVNVFAQPNKPEGKTILRQQGEGLPGEDRADLQTLGWEPWNVVDRGHYLLPTEAARGGLQSGHSRTAVVPCVCWDGFDVPSSK